MSTSKTKVGEERSRREEQGLPGVTLGGLKRFERRTLQGGRAPHQQRRKDAAFGVARRELDQLWATALPGALGGHARVLGPRQNRTTGVRSSRHSTGTQGGGRSGAEKSGASRAEDSFCETIHKGEGKLRGCSKVKQRKKSEVGPTRGASRGPGG